MAINEQTIQCPTCGESISIDVVLTRQIEEKIKKGFEAEQKIKEDSLIKKEKDLQKKVDEIEKNKQNLDSVIKGKVADLLTIEKMKLFEQARMEAEKEQAEKTALLEVQLKSKDEKLKEATKVEVELRKEKMQLEEAKRTFELEKVRQLEESKAAIIEEASKKAIEEQQYVVAQLKKQLMDAAKAKDELARKLEQGSQQTQGEVLELELEELLKTEFPNDIILPVPKGTKGADIIQTVLNRSNRECGKIVWESKKTKSWSESWIQKLKDDQREIKADIAVIISLALPENVQGFVFRDGVWVCDIKLACALATALRINLESITREKAASTGKNEKAEILYDYLTGIGFRQRVEAIVESFTSLEEGLRKERIAYEKIWAEREKQIKKMMISTVGMYGDMSGLVALPQIKQLELGDNFESE